MLSAGADEQFGVWNALGAQRVGEGVGLDLFGVQPAFPGRSGEPAGGFHSVAPNPFNPQVSIKFVTNKANLVQLNVYNIRGEKVRTIVQDRLPANTYDFAWDGTDDAGQKFCENAP